MLRRAYPWILALPLVATSVLIGHSLAYALTGADPETVHDYLEHAPQALLVSSLVALAGWGVGGRSRRPLRAPIAGLGMLAFAAQEHVEGYAHLGHLPFLLDDRTFLVGLALQIPVGVACVLVARLVVVALEAVPPARPRPVPAVVVSLALPPGVRRAPAGTRLLAARGRGPPLPARS